MSQIIINGISFNPGDKKDVLAIRPFGAEKAVSFDYILLQTTQPLNLEQKQQLLDNGVSILEYVPEDTYVCKWTGGNLENIGTLPFVSWTGPYFLGFKVAPALKRPEAGTAGLSIAVANALPDREFSRTLVKVDIVFHKDVDPEGLRAVIASLTHIAPADLPIGRSKLRITVQERCLPLLAEIEEVRHIEKVYPMQLLNNIARQIVRAGVSVSGYLYEGKGQVVAVADTGFDIGSVTDVHPAFRGRVLYLYPLGRANDPSDTMGHGTHVAGSVLGDGKSAIMGIDIRGTAPAAQLVLQSVMFADGSLGGIPSDLHDLFTPPYDDYAARIHSNSWGQTQDPGVYNTHAAEVDYFIWKHRDLVVCFAAGNEGSDRNGTGQVGKGSILAPGTAKNCITVGASENVRPEFNMTYGRGWKQNFPAPPIASDPVSDNMEGMAAFSGRGPTNDFRIKPDVVAPGTYILSARSRAVHSKDPGWANAADSSYFYDGGTSMSTPLVAGCIAVIREYLSVACNMQHPRASLIKALLINGATDIIGQYQSSEAGPIPNNSEGFGRVNLENIVGDRDDRHIFLLRDEERALQVNEQEQLIVRVPADIAGLKVTLVWTDPPGAALQNDLDLIVRSADGLERHGNVDPLSSGFDRNNNVEQVIWENAPQGEYAIIVRAYRITLYPQSYALVIRTY